MEAPADVSLRTRLDASDVDWIVERHGAFHCKELGFDASFLDYVERPLREALERAEPNDRVWIAELAGDRVGSIAMIASDAHTVQLRWFLVEASVRRRGIGTTLLEAALGFARERGFARVMLWTVRALTDAARLYERHGLRPTLIRSGRQWGVDVVEERYDLELDERAVLDRAEMESVARGWGRVADAYVEELFDELERKPADRELLARFAGRVEPGALVGDVGCGPGHVAKFLAAQGLRMQGIDLCPEMVAKARALVPEAAFLQGNMLALDLPPGTWGGCIAFYSLMNLVRDDVSVALTEIARVMSAGAPLAVAVHRGRNEVRVDGILGRPLPMVATLFEPDELAALVADTGFTDIETRCRPPYESEYPSERLYVLARRSS